MKNASIIKWAYFNLSNLNKKIGVIKKTIKLDKVIKFITDKKVYMK